MESETRQFILQCHFTLTETRVAANMKYCHGIIGTTREIEGNLSTMNKTAWHYNSFSLPRKTDII